MKFWNQSFHLIKPGKISAKDKTRFPPTALEDLNEWQTRFSLRLRHTHVFLRIKFLSWWIFTTLVEEIERFLIQNDVTSIILQSILILFLLFFLYTYISYSFLLPFFFFCPLCLLKKFTLNK